MSSYYTAPLKNPPADVREGLSNVVQLAINKIEAGDPNEALMLLVNLLDDVNSKANPYRIAVARKRKPVPEYRGDVNID